MANNKKESPEKKKGFWARLIAKLDKSLEEKSQASACCGGSSDKKKGASCC